MTGPHGLNDAAAGLEELAGLINFRVGAWQDFGYAEPPDSRCADCGHDRTDHLTRAPSRPEPYLCAECDCRQFRQDYATIPPLGERSAKAIAAGHEAIKDIDQLIARLHQVRAQLVSELRQDEDIRMSRAIVADLDEQHGLVGRLVEDANDDSRLAGVGQIVGQIDEETVEVLWDGEDEPMREPFDALRPARENATAQDDAGGAIAADLDEQTGGES